MLMEKFVDHGISDLSIINCLDNLSLVRSIELC